MAVASPAPGAGRPAVATLIFTAAGCALGFALLASVASAQTQQLGTRCRITKAYTEDAQEYVGESLKMDAPAPLGSRCVVGEDQDPEAEGEVARAPAAEANSASFKPRAHASKGRR